MNPGSDFYAITREARRVLVIDPGVLGDAVHLVPALHELRASYPRAELHAICSPVGAEIHSLAGCADRLWTLPQGREERRLGTQLRVLRALRALRFDVSINFGTNDRNVIHAGLIGARHRLGERHDRWHFWSSACLPHWVQVAAAGQPAFERRRQMLAAAGFPLKPARFDLRVSDEAMNWATATVPAGAIHFSINASTHLKEWPLPQWIALARQLSRPPFGFRIVASASASPRERQRLEAFASACDGGGVLAFPGLPIPRLAALLQRCAVHVGADSGALQLAWALGRPTCSLFREYSGYQAWLPQGPKHRHQVASCSCATLKSAPCRTQETAVCLAGISPDAVAASVLEQVPR